MKNLIRVARFFYGTGIMGLGIQQFIYSDFRPVIWPPGWPLWIHGYSIFAYITGVALVTAGIFIILGKKVKVVSLLLGGFLFVVFMAIQCPYVLFIQPNSPRHLGLWTDPLKELALSGGAFVMAGLFNDEAKGYKNFSFYIMEKLVPFGRIFFSITMVSFGIDHFLYTEFVAGLVPAWFPDPTFWTYFAAVALIGSGVAIILEIRVKRIALLLSLMLFLWVIILHIPRAIDDPYGLQGNEVTSVFEALDFSGIALGIAIIYKNKPDGPKTRF